MILIHPECLEELTENDCIGSSFDKMSKEDIEYLPSHLVNMLKKKLYNCPTCHTTIAGTEIKNLSELYCVMSNIFPEKRKEIVKALNVIDDQISKNREPLSFKGDDFLRYQLGVYKLYLK